MPTGINESFMLSVPVLPHHVAPLRTGWSRDRPRNLGTPSMTGTRRNYEYLLHPILRHQSTCDLLGSLTGETYDDVRWINQTFEPRHLKFTSDFVGYCKDGRILHVEQETSPREELALRMLEYAVLILGHHNLQRRISQIVFYTGGKRRPWDGYERHPNGLYYHDRELGYLKFRFAVVDAGEPNDAAFHGAAFPAAALCMLTRDAQHAKGWAAYLARRILDLAEEFRPAAIGACMNVAALRGWSRIMKEALMAHFDLDDRGLADVVTNYVVDDVLLPLARQLIDGNARLSMEEIEPFLTPDLRRVQLMALITNAPKAESTAHLLELSNIPADWVATKGSSSHG